MIILNLIFSLVYMISFITKLFSLREFHYAIIEFDVFFKMPGKLLNFISWLIILSEMLLAACFSLQIYLRTAYSFSALQLLFFAFLFIKILYQKKEVKCNCFGKSTNVTNSKFAIYRNLSLSISGIIGAVSSNNNLDFRIEHLALSVIVALVFQVNSEIKALTQIKSEEISL